MLSELQKLKYEFNQGHFLKEILKGVLFLRGKSVIEIFEREVLRMYNQEEPYYSIERRKEVRDAARKLRKQFLKYQEAEIVYSMTHRKIMQLAQEAGAIYRMDSTVLINRDIFDAYLEQFREKSPRELAEEE